MKDSRLLLPALAIVVAAYGALFIACPAHAQEFRPFSDHRHGIVLEGNFQSCREDDGEYSERIYTPQGDAYELHLGPFHDFALFKGARNLHRDHDAPENRLVPHRVEPVNMRADQRWRALGLDIHVTLAGGSRDECESWYVTVAKDSAP
jgi:hypothetical protein